MKLVCSKNNLLKSVNIVLKAIPGKTTMPILECILIDASTNNIKFTANDMELGIETIVDGTILEKGIVAIDAKIFSDIIRKLPDNDVTIETDGNLTTTITCEKAKFSISGQSGEEFSYLPYVERDNHIVVSQFTLKEVIRQTIFSIAANENNKMMTGELFEVKGDMLRVVSLDGHRISIRKIELKEEYSDIKVVVPGKTLIEISKILSGETEDEVSIFFTKNHIVFEFDDTVVVSRLIEGEYFRTFWTEPLRFFPEWWIRYAPVSAILRSVFHHIELISYNSPSHSPFFFRLFRSFSIFFMHNTSNSSSFFFHFHSQTVNPSNSVTIFSAFRPILS